jgi:hypothetical protein
MPMTHIHTFTYVCISCRVMTGFVLASVACMSSLLLLYMSLDSWQENSVYQTIGLGAFDACA